MIQSDNGGAPPALPAARPHSDRPHSDRPHSDRPHSDRRARDAESTLFEAFVASRTTLDDLAARTAALGVDLSGASIAAMMTGKLCLPTARRNAVADAINARLAELAMPARPLYRDDLWP